MPSIDERVVAMSFENQVFEARVAQTMSTLSKLDTAIKNIGSTSGLDKIEAQANKVTLNAPMSALDKLRAKLGGAGSGAAQGFSEIERAGAKISLSSPFGAIDKLIAKIGQVGHGAPDAFNEIERSSDHVSLNGVSRALDNVTNRFSILQGAASVALGNISAQATMRGAAFAKSFAFKPIADGLQEYATNLNSIQTILANTQGQQVSGLGEVNKHLNELNTYSDKTIYNFSEMAKNIGTFTAAGVDLDKSTQSIKGIANLAALSGSNSQQASTAMYQLSQAIAAGRVSLQDWNSVVNAGMGGAVFQKALIRTGESMGTIAKGAAKIDKATGKATVNGNSFRESITAKPGQKSWLTSDVLVKTLGQFTGDLTDAQLAAQGFNAEQIKTIQQTAKTAQAAATEVKTLPQVFDVARETIGSGWAKTFQLIFGDFNQAKKTFTELSNTINGIINQSSKARNQLLTAFDALGGRDKLILAIKGAFQDLGQIIGIVSKAFRTVFPPATAEGLVHLVDTFRLFDLRVQQFIQQNGPALQRIFAGLFAVLHIGWTVIKQVTGAIFSLLGIVAKGSGGILNFAGSIGDFLVSLDKAISQGGLLKGVLAGMVSGLSGVIDLFKALARSIAGIFTGGDKATGLSSALQNLTNTAGPLAGIGDRLAGAWERVQAVFGKISGFLAPIIADIKKEASRLGDALGEAFKTENFDKIMSVFQTGLLGGILLILRRFRSSLNISLSGGMFDKINTMLGALTGNLKAMQQNLQAKTLFAIAASLGVLVAGIFVLSTIDGQKLTTAMTAMAVGMGQLVGVMGLLGKMMTGPGRAGFLMMPLIAFSMIELATAATILAAAVKIFSTMSWDELIKGLAGVAGSLVAVGGAMKIMGPSTLIQGPALILIAIALNIMAAAVKQFGDLKWGQIVKGIVGIAGSLVALAAGLAFMGPSLLLTGPGLVATAIGMSMLAGAVSAFGSMDTNTLAKGIFGMAGAIVALGLAISFMPPTIALQGAGLIVLAVGLTEMSAAIGILGNMKVSTLVKGIIAMGAALLVLGAGLIFMQGAIGGAAALLLASTALLALGPALAIMGNLKWSTILSGLAAIAVTLGVLAIAGLLVAGPITTLSFALGALGIALGLVTAPIYILAQALALLGTSGTQGIGVMVAALTAFVLVLPKLVIDFLKGIVQIIASIAELAPQVVGSIGVIIGQLLAVIIDAAPKAAVAALALIMSLLKVINEAAPKIFDSGFKLIGSFLSSLSANAGKFASKAGEIISKFLGGLQGQSPRITKSGVGMLTSFLGGISNQFPKLVGTVVTMVAKFVGAVAANIPQIIGAAANLILKFVGGIYSMVPRIIVAGVGIIGDFLSGIAKAIPKIVSKAADVAGKFITGVSKGLVKLANVGADAVINFLNGVANTIRTKGPELRKAGWNVASAILDGIVAGFKDIGHKAVDAVKGVINALPKAARKILHIDSPSKVFHELGTFTMQGFANGLQGHEKPVLDTVTGIGNNVIGHFKDVFKIRSPSQVMKDIGKEVGQGFRDGLDGSVDDIRNSFRNLRDKINDEMRNQRQNIKDENKNLRDLNKQHADKLAEINNLKKHPRANASEIATAQKDLKDIETQINASSRALYKYQAILDDLSGAHSNLVGDLQVQKGQLIALSKELDTVTTDLDSANQALDKVISDRADFIKSTTEQFAKLPDVNPDAENQVADYKQKLQDQIAATKKFYETMKGLRAAGLDDVTFKKLLSEGLGAQDFASQLLSGGASGIKQVNELDTELQTIASQMGDDFGTSLYKVGLDAAQGLVDGLTKRKKEIEDAMSVIADTIVNRIKSALGIQSPSKVLAEIGKFAMAGFADGLSKGANAVKSAAEDAVNATKDVFGSMVLDGLVDVQPTITPVLDLSQVEKDAQKLGDLTNVTPITAAASFGQATAISDEQAAAQKAAAEAAAQGVGKTFNFTQNNTSPEALSDVEIYRNTRNQLAQVKSALGVA